MEYDLIVIGAGPAGYVAAIRAAGLGFRTAVVEKTEVGGTCLNVGCIPTKQFHAAAAALRTCRGAAQFGLVVGGAAVDASLLQKNKKKIIRTLTGGVAALLKANGVTVIRGEAALAAAGAVDVANADSTGGRLTAKRILIASGAVAAELPVEGAGLPVVIDSTGALALESIPARLVIVGGGVIGLEFASIFSTFGSEVTLVEQMPRLLPDMDGDVADALRKMLEKEGVRVLTGAEPTAVEMADGGAVVRVGGEALACDLVLNAIGRKPNTKGLHLAAVGVAVDNGGFICVDENYETNVPGIYAAGDVIAGPMLAHLASAEAIAAVERMAGRDSAVDTELIPQSVFSFPEYSMIGLTEEEAAARFGDVAVSRFFFRGNGRALTLGETDGFVKIVASPDRTTILGVHILGPGASDLIAEAAAAMNAELTVEEYARIVRVHPTLAEALMEASNDLLGQAVHVPPRRGKRGE